MFAPLERVSDGAALLFAPAGQHVLAVDELVHQRQAGALEHAPRHVVSDQGVRDHARNVPLAHAAIDVAVGTWRGTVAKSGATVQVEPFRPLSERKR